MVRIRRALVSVSDKTGVVELCLALQRYGVSVVSSGGTAQALEAGGVAVTRVSEYTGSPEILGGRVKTLHPRIHAGILARATREQQDELVRHDIDPIDLVVVNLYPFVRAVADPAVTDEVAMENVDIGGPAMLRAAAKTFERVAVVVDPADYARLVESLDREDAGLTLELRRQWAAKAFAHTAAYDAAITGYLERTAPGVAAEEELPETLTLRLERAQGLRYGENPHQAAGFYRVARAGQTMGELALEQLHGKELSYNNILDADAAWDLAADLPPGAVCIIKHNNPCGVAWETSGDPAVAYRRALAADPVSAFGGIVACHGTVTAAMAGEMKELFLEAVVARAYEPGALELLTKKKNLRLLRARPGASGADLHLRSAAGGILVQRRDLSVEDLATARVVSERRPTEDELADLSLAWRICKHVKSNAIVLARAGQMVGVGAGQMSRLDSVRLAATRAVLPTAGTALASDAFFPFRDGLDAAVAAGVTAVVQPGGSVRDDELIAAANEHRIAMVFTGVRHFRH